jgi:hypothetical protein
LDPTANRWLDSELKGAYVLLAPISNSNLLMELIVSSLLANN